MFDYCRLGPVDCTAIVNFLKIDNEILMINLSVNKIGCLGCKEISEFLVFSSSVSDSNCKLRSLNLSNNIVTDEGVEYLAKALKNSNCKLNLLDLSENNVTDEGAKCLAEALKHSNCKLNSLNLLHNNITDEGAKCLAEALKHSNCKLNSLDLAGNKLTGEGEKYLAEALKHSNCKLNSLNLSANNVTNEGAKCLAEALRVTDSKYRESLDRFEKSKTLKLCLKNAFREMSSKMLFRFSKNSTPSRNSQKTKIHLFTSLNMQKISGKLTKFSVIALKQFTILEHGINLA